MCAYIAAVRSGEIVPPGALLTCREIFTSGPGPYFSPSTLEIIPINHGALLFGSLRASRSTLGIPLFRLSPERTVDIDRQALSASVVNLERTGRGQCGTSPSLGMN